MTSSGAIASASGRTGELVALLGVIFCLVLGVWSLVTFFPVAAPIAVPGVILALWARRQFPGGRAWFTALALACAAVILASLLLDLTLLTVGGGAPSTTVSPIQLP